MTCGTHQLSAQVIAVQVAHVVHSTATNRTSVAYRLCSQHKVFAVRYEGSDVFPKFQFDRRSGQPLAVMAQLLAAFPANTDGWRVALWMADPNGYLGGRRPVDLLVRDASKVVEAITAEFQHPET